MSQPGRSSRGAILVTGAGSGIGAGCARELARTGSSVVLVGRRRERLADVAAAIAEAGGTAHVLSWDIGAGEDAEALLDAAEEVAGPLEVLVHAAGNQVRAPAVGLALEDFDAVVGLHLRAAFALSRGLARRLIARDDPGNIVYIASLTSERVGIPGTVAYASAKSGLLGLMRTLAVEWGPHRIRVNAIAVGFVATEMTRDVDGTPERQALVGRAPLGRLGDASEIGAVASFLTSDAARFVTGECVRVDGGWSIA